MFFYFFVLFLVCLTRSCLLTCYFCLPYEKFPQILFTVNPNFLSLLKYNSGSIKSAIDISVDSLFSSKFLQNLPQYFSTFLLGFCSVLYTEVPAYLQGIFQWLCALVGFKKKHKLVLYGGQLWHKFYIS